MILSLYHSSMKLNMHKIQDPIVGIRHDEGSVPNTFSCFPLSCKYRTCNNYL